ncbi:transmembrane protein 131 isoform X2 [Cylas formicarius]|uniref:transmembrane protein 131 isoform X2 n=1 Tax=Cylas formicarius TaxID=197179 RepID=UPI00295858C0|nr:transmembrane protein 131 isoform X2 [Cylas formicarius]
MCKTSLAGCFFTFTILELITKTQLTFHDSSHGFLGENHGYFGDEFSHIDRELSSFPFTHKIELSSKANIRFEPEILDFRQRALGIPHYETVTIYNIDDNRTIELTSVSGNTVHFHSSFFEEKRVAPHGNTSFKVVFLGRQEGPAESSLYIHTLDGFIKFNVAAFGIFSQYRLRPIVGVKVPANSTFSPIIYMHNPHPTPIQIVEIYSSGGSFHLELPTGEQEGPNELWEIQPQETKAVIRVNFEAKAVRNHTAYIRIKLHHPEEVLIVPIEVEVTSVQNIFHPQGYIDFGMGGHMDPPKEVNFCLFNPFRKGVRIHSVSTLSKAIKTHYYNVRIGPASEKENTCVHIGTLTVDWKTAWKTQDYQGKIIVKIRNGKNRTEIPYYLSVLKGGLSYDSMATTYFLNEKGIDLSMRSFEVRNEYQYPLKVTDIAFPYDAESIFKIETFTPKTILPFKKERLFNIKLKSIVKKTDMQLTSHIKLITNISEVTVPLLSYNGKLQIHLPFKSQDHSLDVGLIGYDTKKEVYFMVINPNPVSLHINSVRSSVPMTKVELYGCSNGDHKMALLQTSFKNLTKCHNVAAQQYAIIKMSVATNHIDGQVWGDILIETAFEVLSVPVHFKIAFGKLEIEPDGLILDSCFPGKLCKLPLKVYSTFAEKMTVEHIVGLPPDARVTATISGVIMPKFNKVIGHLIFNPDVDCSPECYTGLHADSSATWLKTLVLAKQVPEFDLHLVNVFYNKYLNFTSNGLKAWEHLVLRLDTSDVKGYFFNCKIKMTWPSLLKDGVANNSVLNFPLTQAGNYSYRSIVLHNPASYSLVVQLIFERDYPHVEMLYDGIPSNFLLSSERKYSNSKIFVFDEGQKMGQQEFFREYLKMKVYKQSMPFLLLPGQSEKVTLRFYAEDSKSYSSLLILRNNLTILETVRLNGEGSVPMFKFGNRKPGSSQPLLFEMTDKHMKDCEKQKSYTSPLPNLTVKRSFTARNMGDIPISINSFHINYLECEGYGFKVIDCEPFILPPNGTRKIDIAFTPDLTLSKVTRTLILGTSLNVMVNYTLYTTIPQAYLNMCAELIPRPHWEVYLSYMAIVFMKILFLIILFLAIIDGENITKQAVDAFLLSSGSTDQPILDLRNVGRQIKEEIQLAKEKKKIEIIEYTKNKEDVEEEQKVRVESAIIPTTGKAKKKLAQRNSLNDSLEEGEEDTGMSERPEKEKLRKKDILYETHRLKSKERKTEKELKLMEERNKREKHAQHKEVESKKLVVNKKTSNITNVPAQDEDTSSTTTESSNSSANLEEVDKENQRSKKTKIKQKTVKNKVVSSVTVRVTPPNNLSCIMKEFKPKSKAVDRNKENLHLENSEEKYKSHNYLHNRYARELKRRENKIKDRKEKIVYRNKHHNDRKSRTNDPEATSQRETSKLSSFFIPLPTPTTISSIWGESRAKFSDVVARSECSMFSSTFQSCSHSLNSVSNVRPLNKVKTTSAKPTMYVEPYKPAELGPIGSNRLETPGTKSPDLFMEHNHEYKNSRLDESGFRVSLGTTNSNSASVSMNVGGCNQLNDRSIIAAINSNQIMSGDGNFLQSRDVQRENVCLDNSQMTADTWRKQELYKNLKENQRKHYDAGINPSNQMEDPWNENLLNSSAYWNNPLDCQPSTATNSSIYLWGSNPVWKPWSPSATTPGVRTTPPGFDQYVQKQKEEDTRQDSYNPFCSGSLWTEQQKNPWTYDRQQ